MIIELGITGAARKELAKAVSEIIGAPAEYQYMPTCAYIIGGFYTITNTIKNTVTNIWNSVKSAVSSVLDGIYNTVKGGFDKAVNFVKNLASEAWSWGSDIIDGIVGGIKNCIGKVSDAVKGVADKIRSFLHFSVPDEGPLTDFESWMPDFMNGLADGINANASLVDDALNSFGSGITTQLTDTFKNAMTNTSTRRQSVIMDFTPLTS